jgi:hypothetical protein
MRLGHRLAGDWQRRLDAHPGDRQKAAGAVLFGRLLFQSLFALGQCDQEPWSQIQSL